MVLSFPFIFPSLILIFKSRKHRQSERRAKKETLRILKNQKTAKLIGTLTAKDNNQMQNKIVKRREGLTSPSFKLKWRLTLKWHPVKYTNIYFLPKLYLVILIGHIYIRANVYHCKYTVSLNKYGNSVTISTYCALWSICLLQTLNSAYEHISKHCFCLLSTHALVERNYISLIDLQTDAVNYWNKTFIII